MKFFLEEFDEKHNALGFLRLIFATIVIIQHAIVLGGFHPYNDPIYMFSKGQATFGSLGVASFFIISGYLITQSYAKLDNLKVFFWHRFLRIFPAFWLVLLITALLFGPFLYFVLTKKTDYFLHSEWFTYFFKNSLVKIQQEDILNLTEVLPQSGINGSLWTLEWEIYCYIGVAMLGFFKILGNSKWIPLVALIFLLNLASYYSNDCHCTIGFKLWVAQRAAVLPVLFMSGVLLYSLANLIRLSKTLVILALCAMFVATYLGYFEAAQLFILPYCIFGLATYLPFKSLEKRWGDFSYGLYIYHFPIVHILVALGFNQTGPWLLFIMALAFTLPFAIFSWFFIEKPALSFKNWISTKR